MNMILQGDALSKLKELPSESVDCVMTSPPYWALRDYGVENQLGLEPTFEEYISKLCDIFDEVKRVLKKTGTCWVNLGDTYSATRWSGSGKGQAMNGFKDGHRDIAPKKETNLPDKSLCMIPARFAIEMQNRGWILRNELIWHKPNCMPSSAKDRFTIDFEKIFFFVKNKDYFFDTQYEPLRSKNDPRLDSGRQTYNGKFSGKLDAQNYNSPRARTQRPGFKAFVQLSSQGRIKRAVWSISPKPFKEAHFATYPEALCETPLKAGCPEFICNRCGKPREKILEHNGISEEGEDYLEVNKTPYSIQERKGFVKVRKLPEISEFARYLNDVRRQAGMTIDEIESIFHNQAPHHWFNAESFPSKEDYHKLKQIIKLDSRYDLQLATEYFKQAEKQPLNYSQKGYTDCGCNAGFSSGIVLDPFFGAGTTGLVALKQGKRFIGIELNSDYVKIAEKRLEPYLNQEKLKEALSQ